MPVISNLKSFWLSNGKVPGRETVESHIIVDDDPQICNAKLCFMLDLA